MAQTIPTQFHASQPAPQTLGIGLSLKRALVGGVAGAVASFVVYGVARVAGVDFLGRFSGPDAPAGPLPVPMIAVASLVPAIVAGLAYFGLGKLVGAKARIVFVALAVAFGLFSLGGPASLGDASTSTRIALSIMHLVVAVAITGSLVRGTK